MLITAIDVRNFFFAMALFFAGVNVMKAFFRHPICKETCLLQMMGFIGLFISCIVVIIMKVK